MPQSESTVNYQTIFYMPVIAPLPSGAPADPNAPPPPFTDPNTNYAALVDDPSFAVAEEPDLRLKITLPAATASPVLLSTSGGFITFVPKGDSYLLPDETPLTIDDTDVPIGAGTLVLQTWPEDYTVLKQEGQSGDQAVQYVLYQSANKASVKVRLAPFVQALPELLLAKESGLSPASASTAQMADAFLERLVQGKTSLFVRGGTPLGEIETTSGGTGSNKEIVLQSRDETGSELTLLPFILSMQGRGAAWTGHPLLQKAVLITSKKPISWYLEFRQGTASGVPVHVNGGLVRLMCKMGNSEIELHQKTTGIDGKVLFDFDTLRELFNVPTGMSDKDGQAYMLERHSIFFIVHTPNYDWSTWGWNDVAGLPAYYKVTPPLKIGKANKPKVIQVGLDYHIVFKYLNQSRLLPLKTQKPADKEASLEPAPAGIPVEIYASKKKLATMITSENGEIHGVFLKDIEPDQNIHFKLKFDIKGKDQDTIKIIDSDDSKPDHIYEWDSGNMKGGTLVNYQDTSIPFNQPHAKKVETIYEMKCVNSEEKLEDDIEWAMFFVKTCAEVEKLLATLATDNTDPWKGFGPLKLHLLDPKHSNGRSSVYGDVWLEKGRFNRGNLVHELFHIVMWRVFNQVPQDLNNYSDDLSHSPEEETNEVFAMMEAWPLIWAAAFEEYKEYRNQAIKKKHPEITYFDIRISQPSLYNVSSIITDYKNKVTKNFTDLNPDEGEKIEGVIANSMIELFWKEVVGKSNDADCIVPQRAYDTSTQANKDKEANYKDWLTDNGVKQRFASMLWLPLVELGQIVDFYIKKGQLHGHEPTSTDFLFNILSRITDAPTRLATRQKFQANFMAQDSPLAPTIDSFYQMKDTGAGTVKLEILGKNFTVASTVTYGLNPATPAKIFGCSRNRLLGIIPAAAKGSTTTITVQTQPNKSVSQILTYE